MGLRIIEKWHDRSTAALALCRAWRQLDDADSQGMGDALLAVSHAKHDLMLACGYEDD